MKELNYSLDVVVPCYNEAGVISVTIPRLLDCLANLEGSRRVGRVRILLVDDGSVDATWAEIQTLSKASAEVTGIRLSRNFGHQNAMLAALSQSDADAVLTIDADLQDDIGAIDKMLAAFEAGSQLVLGVRSSRTSDTVFKRRSAELYYRLLSLMGVNTVRNHADFRLLSRQALQAILSYDEVNLFFRGIVASIGFNPTIVEYERKSRELGETKYTLRKMTSLALEGITSFSIAPLRAVSFAGLLVSLASGLILVWVLLIRFAFPDRAYPGWASTLLPLLILGGVQLFATGVLGEYVGKTYMETKRRPRFIVMDTTASGEGE